MSDFERHSTGKEARHVLPGRAWQPDEEHRADMLRRYLGAVAAASAEKSRQESLPDAGPTTFREEKPVAVRAPEVRDAMSVPAVSVRSDVPFLDIVRTLSREHLSAVPVVGPDDVVIGVVSESDLLAKAAVEGETTHPGPIRRLWEHRLYEKSHGETAATLMTSPAITVSPGTPISEAAWLAARSRLKRLPVVDHRRRLVGVVSRIDLVRALVRDDAKIREEIESRIIRQEFLLHPGTVTITVQNGVVGVHGKLDETLAPKLLESIAQVDDVVDVSDHLIAV